MCMYLYQSTLHTAATCLDDPLVFVSYGILNSLQSGKKLASMHAYAIDILRLE